MSKYPVEDEPDGEIVSPHHWWQGILLMVVGFYLWQPQYNPIFGSILALLGLLFALDDWISHYFGIWTPLDAIFKIAMKNKKLRKLYISKIQKPLLKVKP